MSNLTLPPGFAGELANTILNGSYIQLYETAVPATLALLAGVTGRAYRTPTGKDLSQYMILVAPMAVGKDAIHEGIPAVLELAEAPFINPDRFVRREDFVSGAALHRAVLESPGFLNLQGEFGRKLKRMANPSDAPMQELRTKLTRAYSASYMDGKTHSRPEDCLPGVRCPALSFLGETTPRTFFDLLTPDMLEDGFLSRFLITMYNGDRPPATPDRAYVLAERPRQYWREMLTYCAHWHAVNCPLPVPVTYWDRDAADLLDGKGDSFEEECRLEVNASDNPLTQAVYGRAHLKAQKIASQLAVADNFAQPVITTVHAAWAIDYVRRDIALVQQRQQAGDIGVDDDARERVVLKVVYDYFANDIPTSYGVDPRLKKNSLITFDYLRRRTRGLSAFKQHRGDALEALKQVIRGLVDRGYVMEVQKDKMVEQYSFHGKVYRLLNQSVAEILQAGELG